MKLDLGVFVVGVSAMLLVGAATSPSPKSSFRSDAGLDSRFSTSVGPLLKKFCFDCHSGPDAEQKFRLDVVKGSADVRGNPDHWQKLVTYVRSQVMPPKSAGSPTLEERKTISDWFVSAMAPDCTVKDPGRVTLRRLNRSEYSNTVRDLLGIQTDAAKSFPGDDVGYGFDNIGDVLSVSTLHAEKYLSAAEKIARQTIQAESTGSVHYDWSGVKIPTGAAMRDDGAIELFTNCTVVREIKPDQAGDYILRVSAYQDEAGSEPAKMAVSLNGQTVAQYSVKVLKAAPATYELPVTLKPGKYEVGVGFTNDYYDAKFPDPNKRDRNLYSQWIELEGPTNVKTEPPASHKRLLGKGPAARDDVPYANHVLEVLMSRAYRRPVRADELARMTSVYQSMRKQGASFEKSMQVCLTAVLCDPNFLFRIEKSEGDLTGYELASRLSYFLWSSMPDDALRQAAATGELAKPEGIKAQVERMLSSPKSTSLSQDFASQWLQLRKLRGLEPDPKTFPEMTPTLKEAMIGEATLLFDDVVRENRPVTDLLTAKDTFVNGELAEFYGIKGVKGKEFVHVEQTDPARGGLIGMASFLTVTSNPSRTSPVKRGRFVLEELLGTPPPPPPPNVGVLADDAKSVAAQPIKERMAFHRRNPACANCHRQMDAIGFSLENFNGVGKWRTMDGPFPVDATGETPDGNTLKGPDGLRSMLLSRKDDFVHCFTDKLLTFALGRGLTAADACTVDDIVDQAKKDGYRFRSFATAIALSDAFRKRAAP